MKAAVCQEYGQPLVIEDLEFDPPGLPRYKQWWLATVWRKG